MNQWQQGQTSQQKKQNFRKFLRTLPLPFFLQPQLYHKLTCVALIQVKVSYLHVFRKLLFAEIATFVVFELGGERQGDEHTYLELFHAKLSQFHGAALSLSPSSRSGKANKRLEEGGIWLGSQSRIGKQEEI